MAYSSHSVTAITDIPALVFTFAAANGFTVAGSTVDGFTLTAAIASYDHTLTWSKGGAPNARIRSPKLGGTASVPTVSIPSTLHLFGATGDYLAIVIEYGPNLFRHLYLGYTEALGNYTGGAVVSGTAFFNSSSAVSYPIGYRDSRHQYLFSANQSGIAAGECGGVNVVHADNPVAWRQFKGPTSSTPSTAWAGTEVLGGFRDDVNDGYIARALSSYAGVNLLVPINLYATKGTGASAQFVPLGRPAGVRAVNMDGVEPGQEILIGSTTWKVFPAFTKSESDTVGVITGGWGAGETSGMVGYAFLKG